MLNRHANDPFVRAFRSRIEDASFPCVGAKSALRQQGLSFVLAGDLRSSSADTKVVPQLQQFARNSTLDAVFVSKVVLFTTTPPLDEIQFERALWQRLQAWHLVDAVHHEWDRRVSSDPESAQFSLSIGGRGFYVVGLHPGASRSARRFACPALVFNLHSQFEALRADGRYDRLRTAIIQRDIDYSGSANPMLAVHGSSSEARQYSGRQVDGAWRCPFSAQASAREAGARDAA